MSFISPLSDDEILARLRLARTRRIGPVTFKQLLEQFGTAEAALSALPDMAARGDSHTPLSIFSASAAKREIEATLNFGARILAWGDVAYPTPLATLEDAPPILAVSGRMDLLKTRCIGMVGSRNASLHGRRFAARLARDISNYDFTIVSGLAAGIDTAAHEGSLKDGTIGVIAGGIDHVYPADNAKLYAAMRETGAIVAENPIGSKPTARHFPKRNRIISGLSEAVVVVEAALRSGSLITARLAGEQGREVFAVPGAPGDPRSRGTNNLIRQGAILTESVEDILRELPEQGFDLLAPQDGEELTPKPVDALSSEVDTVREAVLNALGTSPVGIDDLVRVCKCSPQVIRAALLQLELAGHIDRHPGSRVSRNFDAASGAEEDRQTSMMLSDE